MNVHCTNLFGDIIGCVWLENQNRLTSASSQSHCSVSYVWQAKLREFLALMPAEQREAAETQLASLPF